MKLSLSTYFSLLLAIAASIHATHNPESPSTPPKPQFQGRYAISHRPNQQANQPHNSSLPTASNLNHPQDQNETTEPTTLERHLYYRQSNPPVNCAMVGLALAEVTMYMHACCLYQAKSNGDETCNGCPYYANAIVELTDKVRELGCP